MDRSVKHTDQVHVVRQLDLARLTGNLDLGENDA